MNGDDARTLFETDDPNKVSETAHRRIQWETFRDIQRFINSAERRLAQLDERTKLNRNLILATIAAIIARLVLSL